MRDITLPVSTILPALHKALCESAVVLQAPPGAGKSTMLPLSLLQQFAHQRWILVQPRRLAALSIAHFIAQQLNERVGEQVGYQVRQQSKRSAKTRLLVVTEGILTRMLQQDPTLSEYDGVIFDEFHERNLHSDLGLALLLESRQLRDDLALLVMSATLPASELATWLQAHDTPCQVLQSEGRQYPVSVDFQPPARQQHYLQKTAQVVARIVQEESECRGILVFVPGQSEIQRVMQDVAALLDPDAAEMVPLHGGLSLAEQQAATKPIAPDIKVPRVIFATNIAETSLTIDGINWVVDSGRERQAIYRPKYQLTELLTRRIAKAAATQRTGRAGRTQAGTCIRIYSESDWHGMAEYRPADIEQQDLTDVVLQVACWGSNMANMAWFSAPNAGHVQSALVWLKHMGAVSGNAQATLYGQSLAQRSSQVRYAHALAQAERSGQPAHSFATAVLIALEEGREVSDFDVETSVTRFLSRPALFPRTSQRLRFWCEQYQIKSADALAAEALAFAALHLYPLGLAKKRKDTAQYTLASGAGATWAAKSEAGQLQKFEWLLVTSVSLHEQHSNGVIRQALALSPQVFTELLAGPLQQQLSEQAELRWRSAKGGLQKVTTQRYYRLLLQTINNQEPVTAEERIQAFVELVQEKGITYLNWDTASLQLLYRLKIWQQFEAQDLQLSDQALLATLSDWAAPFWHSLQTLAELAQWRPYDGLKQKLEFGEQQRLDKLLPTHWLAPSGRNHSINYQQDGSAQVSLKLQEVFGSAQTPSVLNGSLPLTLELLSPAGRPLQRTHDLPAFWQGAYENVKKEMRGRYPKHPWPDDPATAIASHLTKRALNEQG